MSQKAIRIKTDPDPYEAFRLAQAYRVDNMIYVSGQAAINMQGEVVGVGDFDAQAAQALDHDPRVVAVEDAGQSRLPRRQRSGDERPIREAFRTRRADTSSNGTGHRSDEVRIVHQLSFRVCV